jgi:hypothetical protein
VSPPIANYTFLPWLRSGIARRITSVDNDPNVKLRTTVPVDLELSAEGGPGGTLTSTVSRAVQIYGPGDIAGIDRHAIVRTEPRDWVTNFEPNYLPFVEFYDEDFPWRYTPAKAGGHRLRPWIMLVVLEEGSSPRAATCWGDRCRSSACRRRRRNSPRRTSCGRGRTCT